MCEKNFYLKCLTNSHDPIHLPDNKPVVLGRGPATNIKDSRCSRNQVVLVANTSTETVKVTQWGRNTCGLNGLQLKKNISTFATPGSQLDILFGQYKHYIELEHSLPEEPTNSSSDVIVKNAKKSHSLKEGPPLPKEPKLTELISSDGIEENYENWESIDFGQLIIYTSPGCKPQRRIAAYNLFNTIITIPTGTFRSKGHESWRILYPDVIDKLKTYYSNGYRIVIFTNLGRLPISCSDVNLRKMIELIVQKLKVSAQVYIAADYSKYRKPFPTMWETMLSRNGEVNLDESFYCGDQAGRSVGYQDQPDSSQRDYLFSKNVGLKFMTPEVHFLGKKSMPPRITAFDPRSISFETPLCDPEYGQIHSLGTELVLLVGCKGSGKTHFAQVHLVPDGYCHIDGKSLGSSALCLRTVETALKNGVRVVVEDDFGTWHSRENYIVLARGLRIPTRAFVLKTTKTHAKHNLMFRMLTESFNIDGCESVAIERYFRCYKEPELQEGLSEVLKINFWVCRLSPPIKRLYNMFLTDK